MLWGTPEAREVDPSGLLALLVPLLFGYMFPDVGHGLLLVLFALLFSKRWPDIRFLLPCGLAAMAFGLLFGDLFGFDDLIPALWLKPLEQPIIVPGGAPGLWRRTLAAGAGPSWIRGPLEPGPGPLASGGCGRPGSLPGVAGDPGLSPGPLGRRPGPAPFHRRQPLAVPRGGNSGPGRSPGDGYSTACSNSC
jgi:hypothetical protein